MILFLKDRRTIILLAMLTTLCCYFWFGSRYPSLDLKALMAGSLDMADGLSFDAWVAHRVGEGWGANVLTTFLNWLSTNRQGMIFGLSFAVILMALLPVMRDYFSAKPRSRLGATFAGFFLGAPLGVCTNCAAPIAFGLLKRGVRLETAVATMISSPTFNIVVVSMLFSLFPFHIALIKLSLTLVLIFVVIPQLSRLFPEEAYCGISTELRAGVCDTSNEKLESSSWLHTVRWLLAELLSSARYLVIKVVPIMLLAGFLGSVVITILPWESLVELLLGTSLALKILFLFLVSAFGLFMPVPITFDVIISATLLSAGLPVKYAAALLFVLGCFSIYSFMILWRAGARKTALLIMLLITFLGAFSGVVSHFSDAAYEQHVATKIYSMLLSDDVVFYEAPRPKVSDEVAPPLPLIWHTTADRSVDYQLLKGRKGHSDPWRMKKVSNSGLKAHPKAVVYSSVFPYIYMNGIAAADINNDGWQDIVVATTEGLYLYLRGKDKYYLTGELSGESQKGVAISAVKIGDMNNDGWKDIVYSVARLGDYVLYNSAQGFGDNSRLAEYASSQVFTSALALGDIDRNGNLDIVLGRQAGNSSGQVISDNAQNYVLMQTSDAFHIRPLPGNLGSTLSVLLSDLNQDGYLDLMIGNDFIAPDDYYFGTGDDYLWAPLADSIFKVTTQSTMSLDSADYNNDGFLDTYHANISRNPTSGVAQFKEYSFSEEFAQICESDTENDPGYISTKCELMRARKAALSFSVSECLSLDKKLQADCIAAYIYSQKVYYNDYRYGLYFAKHYPELSELYRAVASDQRFSAKPKASTNSIPQVRRKNLLHTQRNDETTIQFALKKGAGDASAAGWSWNSQFADLNGDQWQDLFVVNGFYLRDTASENVFFKNLSGSKFLNRSEDVGLDDLSDTLSYAYLDYDNDSDLDLVTFDNMGQLTLYQNNDVEHEHIQIELRDYQGNRGGVGSSVVIKYADNMLQLREIKASGGFKSQSAPMAHFGLGRNSLVEEIEVRWSTGESKVYSGPFAAGRRYRITRFESN